MAFQLKRTDGTLPIVGDTLPIPFRVTGVPVDAIPIKAGLMFKPRFDNDPTDAAAIVAKEITTGFSGTTTISFSITLSASETLNFMAGHTYVWDLVMSFDTVPEITLRTGEIVFAPGVRNAAL